MQHIKFLSRLYLGLLVSLTMLLSACQTAVSASAIHIPTVSPGLSSNASVPTVLVDDQVSDGKSVVVREVFSQGPGWVSIHNQKANGDVGNVIGYAEVHDGDNRNVIVQIDTNQVTGVMYAMLHKDAGTIGVYEFPGPDEPVFVGGVMVTPAFKWSKGVASVQTPAVTVADQDVKSGVVVVSKVISNGPGWIVIQTQNPDGTPGKDLGYAPVQDGVNLNVSVSIDPKNVPSFLIAVLHIDAGEVGTYESSGPDVPVKVGEQIIASSFSTSPTAMAMPSSVVTSTPTAGPVSMAETPTVTPAANTTNNSTSGMAMEAPGSGEQPVVEASDQPISNNIIIVSRVVSSGPGWIVIYSQVNGQPGEPIGFTAVQNGESKNVAVQIDPNKVTPIVYALLHVDQGKVGTFEFPGPDAPVMIGVKMIQVMIKITTTAQVAGSTPVAGDRLVKVSDQAIRGDTVIIDEIHSIGPGWIGIHVQEPNGSLGPPIGDGHVDDGVTKDLVIKIKAKLATGVMVAMLHYDRGKIGVWEFPGPDAPAEGDMNLVMPSFKITGGLPIDNTVIKVGQSNGSTILVDGTGLTLYTSLNDSPGQSNCDDNCRMKWLPLIILSRLTVGDGVAVVKLGLITLSDGSRQATYGGYPLYYYYADRMPGDNLGQGMDGAWFAGQP